MRHLAAVFTALGLLVTACAQRPAAISTTSATALAPAAASLVLPPATSPPTAYPAIKPLTPIASTPVPYPGWVTPRPTQPTQPPPPTPLPSDTPTPFPTPVVVPPLQTVTADSLPIIVGDVLYRDSGRLLIWHGATGQIEALLTPSEPTSVDGPGAVRRYAVSPATHLLAVERAGPAPDTFELDLFDLNTRALTPVHLSTVNERGLLALAFSPDGQWLAFITKDALPPDAVDDGRYSGTVYITHRDTPEHNLQIGTCAVQRNAESDIGCSWWGSVAWSPDSTAVAWGDGFGIWVASPTQAARLLIANIPADGINSEPIDYYSPLAWSAAGDYLLAIDAHYEGAGYAVIDVVTDALITAPASWSYAFGYSSITWLPDGRLATPGNVWHIDPATSALLLDLSFTTVTGEASEIVPAGLSSLPNGRLGWAITTADSLDPAPRGLYTFTPSDLSVVKRNGLPPSLEYEDITVIWAPNGSGALVQFAYRQIIYAPLDGSALYDLNWVLGNSPCCFAWID